MVGMLGEMRCKMILVITNDIKIKVLVKKYFSAKTIMFVENVENLSDYVSKEFINKSTEMIEKVIIDISSFNDKKEELVKAIMKIKLIYCLDIIIIALGYKAGDKILADLFDVGIYDFIISKDKSLQDREFVDAIRGNDYIDSLKFRSEDKHRKKTNKFKIKRKLKKEIRKSETRDSDFFYYLKNISMSIFRVVSYIFFTALLSIGATAILNKSIRDMILEIILGKI